MNFKSWQPLLLSPRLARNQRRPRRRVIYGGVGFFMLYLLARGTGLMMFWSAAFFWDLMVFMAFGIAWLYVVPCQQTVRYVRQRREAAA